MTTESLVALGVFTFVLLLVALYDKKHRADDNHGKTPDSINPHVQWLAPKPQEKIPGIPGFFKF